MYYCKIPENFCYLCLATKTFCMSDLQMHSQFNNIKTYTAYSQIEQNSTMKKP